MRSDYKPASRKDQRMEADGAGSQVRRLSTTGAHGSLSMASVLTVESGKVEDLMRIGLTSISGCSVEPRKAPSVK